MAGNTNAVIRLGDGSRAELEPDASVVLHGATDGLRELVELEEGGASFQVEKANGRFRLHTRLGSVTALGTEFSVRLLPCQDQGKAAMNMHSMMLAVAVLAGTVQVEFSGRTYVLAGGQERVFGEEQEVSSAGAAEEPTATPAVHDAKLSEETARVTSFPGWATFGMVVP